MREERLHVRGAIRHVQRAHHRTEPADGEIGDDELERVGELRRDHVRRAQRAGRPFDALRVSGEALEFTEVLPLMLSLSKHEPVEA